MKVSIIVGGRWHAIELARELHKAGVLHRLITNYPKFKTRSWGVPDHKVVSLPLTLLLNKAIKKIGGDPLIRKSQPFLYRLFGHAAVGYLEGSTLIHGWSSFSEPALYWAKENGIPFVLERSSSHIKVQLQLLQVEYQKLGLVCTEIHPEIVNQELREYNLADRVAVPSFFAKRSFLEQEFPEQRLIHNPFGTNMATFYPGKKQDNIFRVVYVGSLSVRKGIHYLVKAFMQANIPNSELLLIGGATPETPQLLAGADEKVKCLGHIPEPKLADYYRNSSVFAMPSIEDGFGYVVTQALACGLPLICTTNTGGEDALRMQGGQPIKLENNIEEYPAGYIVSPGNYHAIASLLKLLASNSNVLEQKRQAAQSFQEKDLSWEQYSNRAIEEYQKFIR
ncbi:glycosyltransferase [Mastigocladus laminosus UU774]|nr:glycosyl transferase [Westiellopsis prolifica IICB1]TFI53282.1 glycosyltransferase [Mastigocladus laminosus UU774]